jgi:hypothetical protein
MIDNRGIRKEDTQNSEIPIVFLLGPPGAGKSTLGSQVCQEMGSVFADLKDKTLSSTGEASRDAMLEQLTHLIEDRAAQVIEIPYQLQYDREAVALMRRSGELLALWAHPSDMQARSGCSEPLFTPSPALKTRGGFGRRGSRCKEFRRVYRTAGQALMLVDMMLPEAIEALRDCVSDIYDDYKESPADREGINWWVEDWHDYFGTPKQILKVIVGAMARYLAHLRAEGSPSRALGNICSDLNAAGMLVLMYDNPKGKKILEHFSIPPWDLEYKRKFSDSPRQIARYCRSLEGFAKYLRETGELPKWEDE